MPILCTCTQSSGQQEESGMCLFLQGDAFKTLFVSRISFETTEKKLKREFEEYGPIKRLRMVQDATGILLWPNVK